MKKLIGGGLAALAIGLVAAPVAGADCCETEFDWATPYIEALENHGLGDLVYNLGIPVALAAEDVCQGASPYDIYSHYDELNLAQAKKIAEAVYNDVCPEMAK
jgi:hypothetical protein